MGKKAKGKDRLDKFYHLAKEQGYRSRAAFKLLQLDDKFGFLRNARSVLDLCAAPGGWLQVAVGRAPVGAFVLGIDLFPIRPIRGALSLVEDITTPRCRAAVKKAMADGSRGGGCVAFDVVLHDGSPNVGGAWAQEATAQSALVIDALKLATEFLAPKGIFVTKVFRSQDYNAVLYGLKQLFEKVEVTKPIASRSSSAEIYIVGLRYKAPGKIDPRLLDVKHLFQSSGTPAKAVDVFDKAKRKRHRDGYEDGVTTLRKVGLASDFIFSESPLEFLGTVNVISFDDPACDSIKDNELTTEEVKLLCEDLNVLDKHSFKHLLRWRMKIRKDLSSEKTSDEVTEAEKKAEGNDEDQMLNEMEELANALERKKKRRKKLLSKRRAKDKVRKATGMHIDATLDSYVDNELFSLSVVTGKKSLEALDSSEINVENGDLKDSDEEEEEATTQDPAESDSDEERRRYDEQLEDLLDLAYERYVTRRGGSIKPQKKGKKMTSDFDNELLEADEEDVDLMHSDVESDGGKVNADPNPLLVPLHVDEQPTRDELTERWFSQDVFSEAGQDAAFSSESDGEEDPRLSAPTSNPPNSTDRRMDFEIVPAEPVQGSSSSSSDESETDLDEDEKAETLACAKKMLRKKTRDQIIDDGYNKYIFDDEGLPVWFLEEERRHRQPMKPVTKEEVAAMRAQFKEIDARPAKKVAEAKARKKRVAMKKLDKARQKANSISDMADVSDRSKRKMIESVYRKATPKREKKELVVAKKGVQVRPGKGKRLVDRRMKKDVRGRGSGRDAKKNKMGKKNKKMNKKSKPSKAG
ncbi:ftsJ-like methyltransferase family protein [Wolffia australiana]